MKKEIQKLDAAVGKNGFVYKLVKRSEKIAIYEQFEEAGETTNHFEVFKIRVRAARKDAERFCKRREKIFIPENYPEWREAFPSDEDFGKTAWCYTNFEQAQVRFKELTSN